jgi:hypothetical protein
MGELGVFPDHEDSEGFLELAKSATGRTFAKHLFTIGRTFSHPRTGKPVCFDENAWRSIKANYDRGVLGVPPTVPLANEHNAHDERPERNTGVVTGLERDGNRVIAMLDIRKADIAEQIANGLIGGISAMVHLDYKDQNGKSRGPALVHCCLTQRPFLTDLTPFEEVVAATHAGYTEYGDGSASPPELVMLAFAASPESLAVLGLAPSTGTPPVLVEDDELELSEDDFSSTTKTPEPDPDYGRPAMTDDYYSEALRLGYEAAALGQRSGGTIGGHAAARRQGWRPAYDHLAAEADRQGERIAAGLELTASEAAGIPEVTDDDMLTALCAASAEHGVPLATLVDARDELAAAREPLDNRNPAVRAAATRDIIAKVGGYIGSDESMLVGLTADSESERIAGLLVPLARGTSHVPVDTTKPARPEVDAILNRLANTREGRIAFGLPAGPPNRPRPYVSGADEDALGEPSGDDTHTDPINRRVTSRTRARSGQTQLNPELARFRRMNAGAVAQETTEHHSVTDYGPKSAGVRAALERQALAGGRRQSPISR